jgi:hypothetical protein
LIVRVVIDVNVFQQDWFSQILREIDKASHIVFVFSRSGKFGEELDRQRKLLEFLRLRLMTGKSEVAPDGDVLFHEKRLSDNDDFKCEVCDDPHIFSLVRVKNVKFVFSSDKRMELCRRRMQDVIAREYLLFRVIYSQLQFEQHRAALGL